MKLENENALVAEAVGDDTKIVIFDFHPLQLNAF